MVEHYRLNRFHWLRLFLLCLFLLVSSCAVPTVIVRGTVYDENDCPLPQSIVYTSLPNGVVVDSSGHYSLTIPKKGETMIHFSALGYEDLEIKYSPRNSDGFLNVKMQLDSALLEETIIKDWFVPSR